MSVEVIRIRSPQKPIKASLRLPGSKSFTNRALIIACLAGGESRLHAASNSDDVLALTAALERLGNSISWQDGSLLVAGRGLDHVKYRGEIDLGAAGTSMRFLISFCAAQKDCDVVLSGSQRMHQRPVADLVDAWKSLGAEIEYLGKPGCPPLRIRGRKPGVTGSIKLSGAVSSQFLSSLLMAAPQFEQGLTIEMESELVSKSYVDMTIDTMQSFGVRVDNDDYKKFVVPAGQYYTPTDYQIEPDASGASYFWSVAALSGGQVKIVGLDSRSVQGDLGFPNLLINMGCAMRRGSSSNNEKWIELEGSSKLKSISTDMTLMPDTAQTLAVVASYASGITTIKGLSTLKHKETDRLAALKTELAKIGIESEISSDSIAVSGGRPHAARVSTYEDHRMAMSFACLAAVVDGIEIEDPGVVNKSFPDFWETLSELGFRVESV